MAELQEKQREAMAELQDIKALFKVQADVLDKQVRDCTDEELEQLLVLRRRIKSSLDDARSALHEVFVNDWEWEEVLFILRSHPVLVLEMIHRPYWPYSTIKYRSLLSCYVNGDASLSIIKELVNMGKEQTKSLQGLDQYRKLFGDENVSNIITEACIWAAPEEVITFLINELPPELLIKSIDSDWGDYDDDFDDFDRLSESHLIPFNVLVRRTCFDPEHCYHITAKDLLRYLDVMLRRNPKIADYCIEPSLALFCKAASDADSRNAIFEKLALHRSCPIDVNGIFAPAFIKHSEAFSVFLPKVRKFSILEDDEESPYMIELWWPESPDNNPRNLLHHMVNSIMNLQRLEIMIHSDILVDNGPKGRALFARAIQQANKLEHLKLWGFEWRHSEQRINGVPATMSPTLAQAYKFIPAMIHSSTITSLELVGCNLLDGGTTFAALLTALPKLESLCLEEVFASEEWKARELPQSNLESLKFRKCFLTPNWSLGFMFLLWKLPRLEHLTLHSDLCDDYDKNIELGQHIANPLVKVLGQNRLESFKVVGRPGPLDMKDVFKTLATNTSLKKIELPYRFYPYQYYNRHTGWWEELESSSSEIFETNTTLEECSCPDRHFYLNHPIPGTKYYTSLNRLGRGKLRCPGVSFGFLLDKCV